MNAEQRGATIKHVRRLLGFTITDAAACAGVYIHEWIEAEAGLRELPAIPLDRLVQLASIDQVCERQAEAERVDVLASVSERSRIATLDAKNKRRRLAKRRGK